ncbi:uncharacterized protein N7483_001202 [Penicillium malachiteum]|uniref:uncharacterized protein n=1 Tax=Penicillium malachiteum TaxID=1324776 RepID=UPI0025494F9A|nr:uncharacterized protein N7483_001202 [Penicillium malachiteum]KAJ5736077.1 hypothetical protein N7483_001202 [Penicillium malachiteum]
MYYNEFPRDDEPVFRRAFLIFATTLEVFFTTIGPIMLAVLAAFAIIVLIVLFIVNLFTALRPKKIPSKPTQSSSISKPSSSDVDEKKRVEIEIEFLSELMKSRQERLKQLSKSE